MRVVDVLAELLDLEEVDCVFTVPGGTVVPLMEALAAKKIRLVVAKDEGGAAYAADGYAWATGKPGVVICIGGPGATNALTGLCCSRLQGNPVVLVTGEVGSGSMGRGAAQDASDLGVDVLAMSRPATGLSASGATALKAVHALCEAFRRALHQRCPVHVSLPLDVQVATLDPALRITRQYRAPSGAGLAADEASVRAAASEFDAAERPALLIGNGARHAVREVLELAERLGCAVATTCGGKGIFPERHPLSLGVFSFGSGPLARAALLGEADVLCAIGTRLGEFASMNFSPKVVAPRALLHLDRDASVIGRNYPALALVGDARATLAQLLSRLAPRVRGARGQASWLSDLTQNHPRVEAASATSSCEVPIRPERVMCEIERALPADACVVADIGTSCLYVAHYLRVVGPQRCYIPMSWSCMAHPLVASLGIRIGSGRPTLCVTGDAAFLSKGLELHAAVEARLSGLVWVVLSNRGHGLVRHGTDELLGRGHGVEAGDFRTTPDAAQIARSVGARGIRVDAPSELAEALREALCARGPALLDVRVDPNARPPMADRIQGLRAASAGHAQQPGAL